MQGDVSRIISVWLSNLDISAFRLVWRVWLFCEIPIHLQSSCTNTRNRGHLPGFHDKSKLGFNMARDRRAWSRSVKSPILLSRIVLPYPNLDYRFLSVMVEHRLWTAASHDLWVSSQEDGPWKSLSYLDSYRIPQKLHGGYINQPIYTPIPQFRDNSAGVGWFIHEGLRRECKTDATLLGNKSCTFGCIRRKHLSKGGSGYGNGEVG